MSTELANSTPSDPSTALAPVSETRAIALPGIVARAGGAAAFAAEEFFYGRIRNQHTCTA